MILTLITALLSLGLLILPWVSGLPGYSLFLAFIPLLTYQLICDHKSKSTGKKVKIFPCVVLTFFLWHLVTVLWIKNAVWVGAIAAIAVNTTLSVTAFMVYHYVWRRAPRALAYTVLVCLWTALEYLYINGEITFPWILLGNGFANTVKAVQWYSLTGVLGGTIWVLLVNILIFEAVKRLEKPRGKRFIILPAAAVLIPVAISLFMYYGYKEESNPVKVHIVQPNIDPYIKFNLDTRDEQMANLLALSSEAPADVDYIVSPESSIEDRIPEESLYDNNSIRTLQAFMAERYPGAEFIAGSSAYRGRTHYNSAYQIDTASVAIHHKSKLVAGAEMIPYGDFIGKIADRLMLDVGGYMVRLGTDPYPGVFTSLRGIKTGAAVCYESIYGEYCTGYYRRGAQALFVITNDGWWGDTFGYRQHFSYSRLRAIECRRSIARSANTGISGIINQRGDVVESLGWDSRGTITGEINLNSDETLYMRYGDYAGRICTYLLALCTLYFFAYRIRKKDSIVYVRRK